MEQWSNQGELTETITAVTSLITQSYQYREVHSPLTGNFDHKAGLDNEPGKVLLVSSWSH